MKKLTLIKYVYAEDLRIKPTKMKKLELLKDFSLQKLQGLMAEDQLEVVRFDIGHSRTAELIKEIKMLRRLIKLREAALD